MLPIIPQFIVGREVNNSLVLEDGFLIVKSLLNGLRVHIRSYICGAFVSQPYLQSQFSE